MNAPIKEIRFNRADKDFAYLLNGEIVGFAPTYMQAPAAKPPRPNSTRWSGMGAWKRPVPPTTATAWAMLILLSVRTARSRSMPPGAMSRPTACGLTTYTHCTFSCRSCPSRRALGAAPHCPSARPLWRLERHPQRRRIRCLAIHHCASCEDSAAGEREALERAARVAAVLIPQPKDKAA